MERGSFGGGYETVVRSAGNARVTVLRIALILALVLWTAGNVALVILHRNLFALVGLVYAVSVWLFVRLAWRRTKAEYEYSVFGGELTVSRILGGSSRRELCRVALRELAMIVPYDDEHIQPITQFGAKRKIYAVSGMDAPTIYALLWKEDDEKYLLCIEPDEGMIEVLRRYNVSAFRR